MLENKSYKPWDPIVVPASVKILLIDNVPVQDKILGRHLLKAGFSNFQIDQVEQCNDATDRLIDTKYDIVLLDDVSGNSILAELSIRLIRYYLQDVPIVIISDRTEVDYLRDLEVQRVDYVVSKSDLPALMLKLIPLFEVKGLVADW